MSWREPFPHSVQSGATSWRTFQLTGDKLRNTLGPLLVGPTTK
jgi:hypothetical protein